MSKVEKRSFLKTFAKSLGLTVLTSILILTFIKYWQGESIAKWLTIYGVVFITVYLLGLLLASKYFNYKFPDSLTNENKAVSSDITS